MAKQECYVALCRIIEKQKLSGQRDLAKALGLKQKEAKDLLAGNLDNFTQSVIIRFTAALITSRQLNGTPTQEN